MEKWQLWVLLESSTVFALLTALFVWRIRVLKKRLEDNQESAQADDASSASTSDIETSSHDTSEPDLTASYQRLGAFIERQVSHAVESVKAKLHEKDELGTTKFKIWGTLLKAEKAIIINDNSQNPRPILNRFLASILAALDFESRNTSKSDLEQNLEELDQEFMQAGEVLLTKENLIANQKELHEDLRTNIERTKKRIAQLSIKERELERLKSEQVKLREQINSVNSHSAHSYDVTAEPTTPPVQSPVKKAHSSRHLESLKQLSSRQQTVIEKLQEALDSQRSEKTDDSHTESQKVAIERLERMSAESLSLIEQLNAELDTTNLSIESLRQDISSKNKALQDIEQKLKETDTSVISGLTSIQANKKETFDSIKLGLTEVQDNENTHNDFFINEHAKEVENLERLLQESETCVELLAQELQTSESETDELEANILKAVAEQSGGDQTSDELNALREENKQLANQTSDIKAQIMEQATNTDERALRTEFNRKNLELDRLQLAYSDLERKYLATLS
ncbi:coiled-coil domain-containing protein [Marinomonas mediterranea]|jgi:hypothetical protein|uniref:Uncharacterized protein n=1 Tax=Marinomonas mediterranea (strain ATCC 700492 / JCM 21426 / NBRC 103028 / MMB-1) TaxID=717774 RepID=F2K406_MARM1|nr:hypothetical protein [Marinomonas mediterranea]ADZ91348.1 hypothetical protein Marme_2100 [Marinomonas mediterranea MMB-1]WCN17466.1 hypothetical protein GV053_10565 [Marinomonas mediterranea MMB-1]